MESKNQVYLLLTLKELSMKAEQKEWMNGNKHLQSLLLFELSMKRLMVLIFL